MLSTLDFNSSDNILTSLQYMKIAHNRDVKNAQFLSSKVIYNKTCGTIAPINYNEDWHLNQSYIYNTCKIDELNEQSLEQGLVPIFITLTLPAEYHPSSKEYNPFTTIKDGYDKLLEIFRALYHEFYIDRKRVKNLKFIRVVEPHKSFIPHLHAVIYVQKENVDKFYKHYNNTVKRFELKQVDFKKLDEAKYAVTYLLKYVQKTLEGDDSIRGWKIHHGLKRTFTMSNLNVGLNRQIFSKITRYVDFNKESDLNYFRQILKKVGIKKVLKDALGNILDVKHFGALDSNIFISIETKRVASYNPVTEDSFDVVCYEYREDNDPLITVIDSSNEYDIEYDIEELEKENYRYFLDGFIITVDSKEVYNKQNIFMQNSSYYHSD